MRRQTVTINYSKELPLAQGHRVWVNGLSPKSNVQGPRSKAGLEASPARDERILPSLRELPSTRIHTHR